jgi:hypothetical protein
MAVALARHFGSIVALRCFRHIPATGCTARPTTFETGDAVSVLCLQQRHDRDDSRQTPSALSTRASNSAAIPGHDTTAATLIAHGSATASPRCPDRMSAMPVRAIATAAIPLFMRAQQRSMHISRLHCVIATSRFTRIRPVDNGVAAMTHPALSHLLVATAGPRECWLPAQRRRRRTGAPARRRPAAAIGDKSLSGAR